jgi:hypothetical protein
VDAPAAMGDAEAAHGRAAGVSSGVACGSSALGRHKREGLKGFVALAGFSCVACGLLAGDGKDFTGGCFGLWVVAMAGHFEQGRLDVGAMSAQEERGIPFLATCRI